MRIVGGKYRHRLINWPGDMNVTRPTKDRIREAIFSALGDIEGLNSLDLYAGSGAMGIESLSRGCKTASFVDTSNLAIKTIQENLDSLKVEKNEYVLYGWDDKSALKIMESKGYFFDLVFLDPPYEKGEYYEIISQLFDKNLLSEKAIIVVEANKPQIFDNNLFNRIKEYKYGPIYVYILWR